MSHATTTPQEDAMPNDEIPTDTEAAEALDTPQEATPHASHDPGLTLVTDPPVEAAAPAEDFKRKYDATHGRLMTTVRQHQDYQKEVNASYAQINTEMDLLRQENEKLRAEAEAHRPPEPPPAELVDELGERAAAAMWNAMLKRQGKPSAQQSATPDPQSARAPANPSSARFAAPQAPQIDERTIRVQTHLDYAHSDWKNIVFGADFKQWGANTVNPNTSQTFKEEFDRANTAYDAVGLANILNVYKAATGGTRAPSPEHVLPVIPGGSGGSPIPASGGNLPSREQLRALYTRAAAGGAAGQTAQDQINIIEAKMKKAMATG